ncbi:MAG TPA: DNA-processing protein DprA [Candidatus Binatia bacterium]|nr:DNA-processing protein DprA [Candidatus Binatia bacterium]
MLARNWIALQAIAGVGAATCRRLFEAFGSAEAVFRASPECLARAGLRPEVIREIVGFRRWTEVDEELRRAGDAGADLVSIDEARYPAALRFIHDPPPVLYVRGRLERVDVESIAIVGSRSASPYGLESAERLAGGLAAAGVTVVSGLAIGIDAAAHRGALAAGGRTIAVLGCGIDQVYPARHRALALEMAEAGAVVSELRIGTPPEPHQFPRRNRLVSGLSLGVVVVEASERSGSLITARLALEQGRDVLAVPGEIGLERTRGSHRLIRQGATLVESARDVLESALPWRLPAPAAAPPDGTRGREELSADAVRLLGAFESVTEPADRLIERSGLNTARALEILLELELAGRVRQHPGMRFSRRVG